MSDTREQMEKTADRIRDDLMTTLKELDRRRHDATDFKRQLESHWDTIVIVGLGAATLAGVALGVSALRRRARRRSVLKRRLQGLVRAWQHPERLATRAKERPLPAELGRKLLTTFVLAVGTRLAKQFADSVVEARGELPSAQEPKADYVH